MKPENYNVFKTKNGRKVFDGGGVFPDEALEVTKNTAITDAILNSQSIFDFATKYYYTNKIEDISKFKLTEVQVFDNQNCKSVANFSIGILGFYYLFYTGGNIPLLSDNAEIFRIEFSKGKGTQILLFTALIYYGSLNYIIINGLNLKSIIIIVLGSTTILMLGYRSPAFYYLIACFLAFYSNNKSYLNKGKFNYKLILLLLLLLPISAIIGLLRAGFTPTSLLI